MNETTENYYCNEQDQTQFHSIAAGRVKVVSLHYSRNNVQAKVNSPERFPEPISDWMRETEKVN